MTRQGHASDGSDWRESEAFRSARRNMKALDRDSLLAALGGLALDPANAVQQLRLEALAHVAATIHPTPNEAGVTVTHARKVAARAGAGLLPAAPDPPEQPFALPFAFGSTDSVVPLGLILAVDHDAHRMLELLAELAIESDEIARVERQIEGVLRLVGRATRDAGLIGVVAPGWERDRAHIPAAARLEPLIRATHLSAAELRKEVGDDWGVELEPLIADATVDTVDWDGQNGSLSYRPLIRARDGGLIIAVPGMVLPALLRCTISQLARLGPDDLADRYADCVWRDIERSLGLMRIDRASKVSAPKALVGHSLFRIDEEQLLAVLLVAIDPFAPERTGPDPYEALAAAHRELLDHGPGHVVLVLFQAPSDAGSFFGLEAPPPGVTDLLMTPAELAVVAQVEPGEPRTLAEYAVASSQVRESVRVFGFGFLDEFTIYRQHQSSYYLDDTRRPTMISVAPGSGLELRMEAAQRGVEHVVRRPLGGEAVRIMPRWDARRGVWAPVPGTGQPVRVVLTQPRIWVVGAPYQSMEASDVEGWESAVDSVAYWLWELRGYMEPMLANGPARAPLVAIDGVDEWRMGRHRWARGPLAIRIDQEANVVRIRAGASFGELARSPDNEADRLLVAGLLDGLSRLTGAAPSRPIGEIVNDVAPPGLKKMLLMVDIGANVDIGPDDVPRWRAVRDAPVSVALDELGAALTAEGWAAGPAGSKSDRMRILHRAVDIVFSMLEREVSEFGPDLLEALLLRNEAILRERAQQGFHLPPRLRCFPEDAGTLREKPHDMDQASVAGRFLIEYVAARPSAGTRGPSVGSMDRLVALADVLIQRGHAADLEYLDLVNTNARMLESGRLGINDGAMRTAMDAFAPSLLAQRHADAEASFRLRWREPRADEVRSRDIDKAARREWGFSLTEMAQVIGAAAGLSLDSGSPVLAVGVDDCVRRISTESDLDTRLVARVLAELTLAERPDFDRPDPPYERADVYPWRFNRRLSLLRKPFVRRPTATGPELVFGRRALIECAHYTMELVTTSRLRCRSVEMERLKGKLSVERGAAFNERVAVELEVRLGRPVRRGVTKVGRLRLAVNNKDIGDVDVLGADVRSRTIWAIECKALAPARTPHELAWELAELVGTEEELGLLGKHTRRLDWLIAHRDAAVAELSLEGSDWTIKGAFVVDDDLLGPYVRETPVPVVTLARLLADLEFPPA
jgi:hypothetical protein